MSSKSFSLRTADILASQYLTQKKHARARYVLTQGNFLRAVIVVIFLESDLQHLRPGLLKLTA